MDVGVFGGRTLVHVETLTKKLAPLAWEGWPSGRNMNDQSFRLIECNAEASSDVNLSRRPRLRCGVRTWQV